jgi:hypothetical protein
LREVNPGSKAVCEGELFRIGEGETGKHENVVRLEGLKALLRDTFLKKRGAIDVHDSADRRLDGFDPDGHDTPFRVARA